MTSLNVDRPLPRPEDLEHLRLLSIFHYVLGGLTALFACFPLIHLTIGIVALVAPHGFGGRGEVPPPWFGWLFILIGGGIFLVGEILTACMIAAGRALARRKFYGFCFAIACLECVLIPFGTVLGTFTIITLSRESVKASFSTQTP